MILFTITYLAGVLTILSPCILPVLPFVFSKTQGSFLKNGLPLLVGMALTFSLLSAVAIAGGAWVGQANEIGRALALALMAAFGLSLLFPHISEKVFAPLTRFGSRVGQGAHGESLGGSILIGVSTGLLWAPCAGPILGLVLTGAAAQGNIGTSVALLLCYSFGATTSLALALVAGDRFLKTLKRFLGFDQALKKGIGIAVLVGVAIIAFNLDRTILTKVSKIGTDAIENKLLTAAGLSGAESPNAEGLLPELDGATGWINSKPLNLASLKGKVVLVDFWTYSCINCLRTLPYLKAWNEKYKGSGLVIIGVHTPEFAFEKNRTNIEKAVNDLGITYPVAIDSDYKIWNAFGNHYWPAHYFVDRQGRVRHHHFGEGEYDQSEEVIRELLAENGTAVQVKESTAVDGQGVEAQSSREVDSPETYVGYSRAENFIADQTVQPNRVAEYKAPQKLDLNQWSLDGNWLVEDERAILRRPGGKVVYRFKARDLHLVLGGTDISFKVTIDGHAPGKDHGTDTDEAGRGKINGHRLFQLIRQTEGVEDHVFEIEFLAPGAEVYAFTFG
jgi:cytochrome c biogenesis protein CcdA/thiol-disulfide isomerase/thioredoxin